MTAVNYLWNPINDNIVREFDDAGATIAEYTTEPDLYGNVVSQHRNGQTSYLLSDGQGNTTELTNDAGNVTDTIRYSAFGEVTQRTGMTEIPFQYVGQKGCYRDEATGYYSVRRRPYRPSTGTWLSVESLEVGGGEIRDYLYALNRAAVYIDPSGNIAVTPICEEPKYILGLKKCGSEAVARWAFRVEKKKHCAGFLVQHVEVRCKVLACELCPIADGDEIGVVAELLEAWYVEEDKDVDAGFGEHGYTDKSNYTARDKHCGVFEGKGLEIKFFCMKDIGDLRKTWKKDRKYGTLPYCDFSPGDVISIGNGSIGEPNDKLPDWSSQPGEEKAGSRNFALKWTCCGCELPENLDAKASPDPRDKGCEKASVTK